MNIIFSLDFDLYLELLYTRKILYQHLLPVFDKKKRYLHITQKGVSNKKAKTSYKRVDL